MTNKAEYPSEVPYGVITQAIESSAPSNPVLGNPLHHVSVGQLQKFANSCAKWALQGAEPVAGQVVLSRAQAVWSLQHLREGLTAYPRELLENAMEAATAEQPYTSPPAPELPRESCAWIPDDDGVWDTSCGNRFEISEGTPAENDMGYCCYCGKALLNSAPPTTPKG